VTSDLFNDPISVLQKIASTRIAADGTATISLRPDVGQYWAPTLVQVATRLSPFNTDNMDGINSAVAILYRGSTGGTVDNTNYIDDTYNGSGDSSSIISGTIISYGETITCVWSAGTPGDTATMLVFGRSSNNLVDLQRYLLPIPGTRFAGNAGSTMIWDYNDDAQNGPGSIRNSPPTFTAPANLLCEIVSAKFTVATDAVAGVRFFGLTATVFDGLTNVRIFNVFNSTLGATAALGQPPSSTVTYNFNVGINNYDIGGSPNRFMGISIPPKLVLPPGAVLSASQNGSDIGDLWNTWQMVYRQYKTLAKLGSTG
jgi:hypothetical protein